MPAQIVLLFKDLGIPCIYLFFVSSFFFPGHLHHWFLQRLFISNVSTVVLFYYFSFFLDKRSTILKHLPSLWLLFVEWVKAVLKRAWQATVFSFSMIGFCGVSNVRPMWMNCSSGPFVANENVRKLASKTTELCIHQPRRAPSLVFLLCYSHFCP